MNTSAIESGTILMGYADRISAATGEIVRCMVSCSGDHFDAHLVRLIHGDPSKKGPGFQEEEIESEINKRYAAKIQPLRCGSYGVIGDRSTLRTQSSITLQAWIFPTIPAKGLQGILTKWIAREEAGYGLFLDAEGHLAFGVASGARPAEWIHAPQPLRESCWHFVAASYDAASGQAFLYKKQLNAWPPDCQEPIAERSLQPQVLYESQAPVILAAFVDRLEPRPVTGGHFNGKIDGPKIFNRALDRSEIWALHADSQPTSFGASVLGWWDFSKDISSKRIVDRSPHQHHGVLVNMPARAVTGHNWNGETYTSFLKDCRTYGAVHFHDDDLDDAGWDESFTLRVPAGAKSGIYAIRLRSEDAEFHVPLVLKPGNTRPRARVVFLAPSLTWQAYANFNEIANEFNLESSQSSPWLFEDRFIASHPELGISLYDHHSDGSTPFYASRLRPNLSGGPRYKYAALDSPHLLAADLYITAWLESKGIDFDVICDEDLHFDGANSIESYGVVITGAHPEYWTLPMLNGIEDFLNGGGNLMYLGGNGLYWVTSLHAESPAIEVRRSTGTGLSRAAEGELFHSTTGELGGIWRVRGRAPQNLLGVGFSAQGGAPGSAYRRQPDSFNPRAAFIFDGIGKDELIGKFGLSTGAAAGFEIDRLDYGLGTPAHTLLLASSEPHHDSYWHVVEETSIPGIHECGSKSKKVRADMTFYEHPGGGAVFSTGSIAWAGSLSENGYKNNVSRITENVLKRFMTDARFQARELCR